VRPVLSLFRAASAAVLLAASLAAGAQPAAVDATGPPAEPRSAWSIAGGWGHTAQFVTADQTSSHLLLVAPQWSYRLGRVVETVVEGHFAGYVGSGDGWFLGLVPIGLRFRVPDSSWRPYVALHAGFGWTDLRIIELERRFNFILEGGLGGRAPGLDGRLSFEIRLVHYSNAGTVPPNYGLNSIALIGAWRLK
jgi:hypothetical protein